MQSKNQTRTNKARTEATRLALVEAGRKLFAQKGFADTSTPEVVKTAGVTRGALYHHYDGKTALFRAVVVEEFKAVAQEIESFSKSASDEKLEQLMQGSRGYLKAMEDKGRVRIMLLDGPAVLGQAEIGKIDRETSADTLRVGLLEAMHCKQIKALPIDALTLQLSALFDCAALAVSEGDDPEDHLAVIDALMVALANDVL